MWVEAMEGLLESEEWPKLGTILWICGNCLTSWKGIGENFCSEISPKANIHFNLQEIAKKLAEAHKGPEPASMVLSVWKIAQIVLSPHGCAMGEVKGVVGYLSPNCYVCMMNPQTKKIWTLRQ